MKPILNKSLEQVENEFWKDVVFPTELVKRCYKLRKKKIKDLSISEVRLLITQNLGVSTLMPIALDFLRKDILVEGEFYPGDLLDSVISLKCDYWKKNRSQWDEAREIISSKVDFIRRSNLIGSEIRSDIFLKYDRLLECI